MRRSISVDELTDAVNELKEVKARLAAAESRIRSLEAAVASLQSRNRPLGPQPWRTVPPYRELFKYVEPLPMRRLGGIEER
jgi:hypothetical protein